MVGYSGYEYTSPTTSAAAWQSWNTYDCGTSVTGTGEGIQGTWYYWNNGSQTSAIVTISANQAWGYWVSSQDVVEPFVQTYQSYKPTKEELRQQRERILADEERRKAKLKQREEADVRALELLQDILTEDDFAFYQKHGRLLIKGRQYDYLIQKDSGTVVRLEKDKVADLCMHLDDHHAYSRHDNVIAMKLFLEAREEQFNREANLHRVRPPQGVEREALRAVNE